jgi:hypothetical protein
MAAGGRHKHQPLELQSSEEENALQQVDHVEDLEEDNELFTIAKWKKSSGDVKRKWDLLKDFSVKNRRQIFDKSLSSEQMCKSSLVYSSPRRRKLPPAISYYAQWS